MKTWLLTAIAAVGLAAAPAYAGLFSKSVTVKIYSEEGEGRHASKLQLVLEQTKTGFECRTKETPKHRISVRGLKSLDSPVTVAKKKPRTCEQYVKWGRSGYFCYKKDESRVLDDLIRQCSGG